MPRLTPFFFKQSIFDPCPINCSSFSKNLPSKFVKQLFSRWSINFYCLNNQNSKRRHSLLQRHLEYVMHIFELTSPKVSIFSQVSYAEKGFQPVLPVDCLIFVSCSPRQIVQKLFNKLEIFGAVVQIFDCLNFF